MRTSKVGFAAHSQVVFVGGNESVRSEAPPRPFPKCGTLFSIAESAFEGTPLNSNAMGAKHPANVCVGHRE